MAGFGSGPFGNFSFGRADFGREVVIDTFPREYLEGDAERGSP